MPRRVRTKRSRRLEAWERGMSAKSLRALAATLHREWREREAEAQVLDTALPAGTAEETQIAS